jgi:cell division protein FtsQ
LGLSNGVVLRLGQANVDARFERFMATGSRVLANRAQEIAYIDLRYASGFAVGLRTKESG